MKDLMDLLMKNAMGLISSWKQVSSISSDRIIHDSSERIHGGPILAITLVGELITFLPPKISHIVSKKQPFIQM
jgi:hypothetical protein